MKLMIFFMQQMLLFTVPLVVAGMGGLFCERSGIINIGIEGNMIIGAFCGTLFIHFCGGTEAGQGIFLEAMLIGGGAGMCYSMLHALASIKFNANQAISGIALNIAAPAICIFIGRLLLGKQQVTFTNSFRITSVPVLGSIPVLGPVFFQKTYLSLFVAILAFIAGTIIINKTRFGMRVRACGDNPQAADSVGINVYHTRYRAVAVCGFLAGMAGVMLVIPTATEFNASIAGYGFLAVSVLILGRWSPLGVLLASAFFGATKTLAAVYSSLPLLNGLGLDAFIYRMIPFIATLVVLAITSVKSSGQPLASGKPYDKGAR